jgi:putative tryptophan/tyrosine transport system substrate-binding protein
VRLKVDVIVASLTPSVKAAKEATSDIPIVMAPAGDPLQTGLVASLARPGGNVTGVSTAAAEVAGKTIELIHEVFPSARRVAVLANATDSFTKPYLAQVEDGGRRTGLAIEAFVQRPDAPLEPAFEAMRAKAADALVVQGTMSRKEVVELAIKYRLASEVNARGRWPEGSCHIPQVLRRCMRWRRATSTRSSKGERPPICRSRSPRNSTWSST